jgi:serine/threonine protein phosphatase 1
MISPPNFVIFRRAFNGWFRSILRKANHDPKTNKVTLGNRYYCIGDIHGCVNELQELNSLILDDSANFSGKKVVIYLGDYVDRGIDSRGVIDYLLDSPLPEFESIYLMGNHEHFLLRFLEDISVGEPWLRFGGLETLESYDINIEKHPKTASDFQEIQTRFIAAFPMLHKMFLLNCSLSYEIGDYFFCHAGINPRVPLNKQSEEDLLWIRDEFLGYQKHHEKVIVHGHTIFEQPEILHNRIGIDTGAYRSGILSCLVLEGETKRIIQTKLKNA